MSKKAVREGVLAFLATNAPTETVVDLTAQYDELRDMLEVSGVQPDAPWLGIEFTAFEEEPVSLSATNDQGLYRELGMFQLHVCAQAKIGVGAEMLDRAESLLNLFRGARIGGIVIQSVRPLNTGPGATLEFEAGYVSGTVDVEYYFDHVPGI